MDGLCRKLEDVPGETLRRAKRSTRRSCTDMLQHCFIENAERFCERAKQTGARIPNC